MCQRDFLMQEHRQPARGPAPHLAVPLTSFARRTFLF
jgi:hypothetical protein